jgi:hypothetical protein
MDPFSNYLESLVAVNGEGMAFRYLRNGLVVEPA